MGWLGTKCLLLQHSPKKASVRLMERLLKWPFRDDASLWDGSASVPSPHLGGEQLAGIVASAGMRSWIWKCSGRRFSQVLWARVPALATWPAPHTPDSHLWWWNECTVLVVFKGSAQTLVCLEFGVDWEETISGVGHGKMVQIVGGLGGHAREFGLHIMDNVV